VLSPQNGVPRGEEGDDVILRRNLRNDSAGKVPVPDFALKYLPGT
jgi:hypothetical protein